MAALRGALGSIGGNDLGLAAYFHLLIHWVSIFILIVGIRNILSIFLFHNFEDLLLLLFF